MRFKRIVQLTDIHFCKDPQTTILDGNPEKAFEKVFNHLLMLEINPDLIIATGDLAEDGSVEAYSRLRSIFENSDLTTVVLPGNHDSISNMKSSLVSPLIKMQKRFEVRGWQGICLDSTIVGQDSGRISDYDLRWLEDTLTQIHAPCLIALHHSPVSNCLSSVCQLDNGEELLNVLAKFKQVKVVISGHTHWAKQNEFQHIQLLTTPSTFLHVVHPQSGDGKDPQDVYNSHNFDIKKFGYRVIDLFENGRLRTEVVWV